LAGRKASRALRYAGCSWIEIAIKNEDHEAHEGEAAGPFVRVLRDLRGKHF
jgi:hypothetical protein